VDTFNIVGTLVLLVGIIVYFILKRRNEKGSSWTGELIKKQDISDEEDQNHIYRLVFKTDEGKTVKVLVKEDLYNQAQIGEKYQKMAGIFIPKKVQ
jgi:hypothetical protein